MIAGVQRKHSFTEKVLKRNLLLGLIESQQQLQVKSTSKVGGILSRFASQISELSIRN